MAGISLKTSRQAFPMVYAYSTPQIAEHDGWTKIGYTERNVDERIRQQTHTSDTQVNLEWKGNAIFEDGTGERFTDKDFHAYLRKAGIGNKPGTEWFHVNGDDGYAHFNVFRRDRGVMKALDVVPYTLRKEQDDAVTMTKAYAEANENGRFLWNAKPRFGKTLAVYDLCKRLKAKKVLIVTNRPAIANSWYDDYERFMGDASGFKFVSETESLRNRTYVLSRDRFLGIAGYGVIEFVSLQDLKGSIHFGGPFDKLGEVAEIEWDMLVIDEAHEGVDTLRTDTAFDNIRRRFTLHLSGTPFKALAGDRFRGDEIYNWTYADEQRAKRNWTGESEEDNPYAALPRLNMFTYRMSEIVRERIGRGIDIDGDTEEFAFDLNEFFGTRNGDFVHEESVTRFLDALTTQEKFPFSTEALRDELRHTFWILNRVESAKALAKKLQEHPVFSRYAIVLAAGDGRLDDVTETAKSYDKVVKAIKEHDRTITLSVGQLTTGVTIPEWSAVMMLSNMKSPSLYMQAAFRAQNPCMYHDNGRYFRKENAYVFDFDPARTLTIFDVFANDLSSGTAGGKGDTDERERHVRELLNFFPVIGEDEEGTMIPLDAGQVLSIPRRIRSAEVVRRGFMSNYLFQNVGGIFGAPQEVIDIISRLQPVDEPRACDLPITPSTGKELGIDPETGEVDVPQDRVIGTAADVFGDKIYGPDDTRDLAERLDVVAEASDRDASRMACDRFKDQVRKEIVAPLIDTAKAHYRKELRASDARILKAGLDRGIDNAVGKVFANYRIKRNTADLDLKNALRNRHDSGRTEKEIRAEFDARMERCHAELTTEMHEAIEQFVGKAKQDVTRKIEQGIQERKKEAIEDTVRDRLRGFARTIPSFLMAYGEAGEGRPPVTLASFDAIVPDHVFADVTSITVDEFRFLRDGGTYTDATTGEVKRFVGHLFDPVVFDDSVKEFLALKRKLADYFDERNTEDIFDYIPPQRTNQIFTPKRTVKDMVDMLEKENPGCFDDPDKTFIDPYMKSGLYVTELVKRLYRSRAMQAKFPDARERLRHIFAKQVYGLAPTEIIYRIALAYILGFDEAHEITRHNLRLADATPYAKAGNLQELTDRLFDQGRHPDAVPDPASAVTETNDQGGTHGRQ